MGLFDTVKCEHPLLEPEHRDLEFQTKDLPRLLEDYTITEDGRLVRHAQGGPFGDTHVRDIEWPVHGDIRLFARDAHEAPVEYVVRFTHGRVEWVRRMDHGEPQPRTQPHVRPAPPAIDPHLVPTVEGRRLIVEEFSAFTPEKLELVDGHIPGEEDLLRLLLVGIGLGRAAEIVGPALWATALEPRG